MKNFKFFKSILLLLIVCICAFSCGNAVQYNVFTHQNGVNSIICSEIKTEEKIEELLTSHSSVFVLCGTASSKKSSLTYSSAELALASYYYFKMDELTVTGELYTSPDISESELYSEINKLQAKIESGEIVNRYKTNECKHELEPVNAEEAWEEHDISHISAILSCNGVYYGNFAEWRTVYKLTDSSYNEYYAFINESYITPNPDKTDYRTDKIIYRFTPRCRRCCLS